VWSIISFGVGRRNNEKVDHALFDDAAWKLKAIAPLKEMARNQLGTVGSGNHYVDLFTDEQDRVWIGVHFGSRGLGHKTATHFLKAAGASDGMDVEPCVLPIASDLGAPIVEEVHNHHNYAWREEHQGEQLWVVRKGATPAFPGQRGFVGGTMGEQSVILEGIENDAARYSLHSTVHGAGRAMGRREAAGVVDRKTGEVKRAGKVTPEMMRSWIERSGVELRGAGLDESPDCYKRLDDVLDAVEGTVRILHRLTPVGVAMAGANEFDPYKD
jgi:tRNA-splicing ligase RtcB